MRKPVIGVMGGGESASAEDCRLAYRLGALIAAEGWILLNGGRNIGVMDASARGARDRGGLTVGILPGAGTEHASRYIDIAIVTNMGGARNVINVLSSDIIVAMAGKAGTISEIALALKYEKPVILLNFDVRTLFQMCSGEDPLHWVHSAEEAIGIIKVLLARREYTSHETSLPEKLENMQPEA
jgi:uncharacterized protein (TIGR00725 family)